MDVRVGQKWRADLGMKFTVVGFDDGLVLVKRSDSSKKQLASGGGYLTALSEFEKWTLLEDAVAMREP